MSCEDSDLDVVTEGEDAFYSVTFKDEDGNVAVPTSVSVLIQCLTNQKTIRADTALIPPFLSTMVVQITALENAMLSSRNQIEVRRVVVTANYGIGGVFKDKHLYELERVSFG